MKKILLPIVLGCSIFVSSCQTDQIFQLEKENFKEGIALLNHEKIFVPKGVDSTALQLTTKADAGKYIQIYLNRSGGRTKNLSDLSSEGLMSVLRAIDKKYPSFDFSLDKLPENHFNFIKRDFPNIKTEEDVYNRRETIALYYENLKRYELLEKIKNNQVPNLKSVKTKYYNPADNRPIGWQAFAVRYFDACVKADQASEQALAETAARFGSCMNDFGYSNAFQHSAWCGLTARKLIATGASKINGVGEAGLVTAVHESPEVTIDVLGAPKGVGMVYRLDLDAAMDLWNNSIGRSYVYHNTTFGVFGVRTKFPSEQRVLDEMHERICQRTQILTFYNAFQPPIYTFNPSANPAPLLNYVQSPESAAWETLYRHSYSDWSQLMIVKHDCFCQ